MDAILSVQHGALSGRSFRLGRRVRVGRSRECDIVLPDKGVAPFHFVIEDAGGHFLIRDAESGRPTFVDGASVVAERLKDRTTIYAGEAVLFFRTGGPDLLAGFELRDAGRDSDLENEVRRVYESSVTYLDEPEPAAVSAGEARTALSALYQAGRIAGDETDLAGLFGGFARVLLEATAADRCALLLHEGSGRFTRAAQANAGGIVAGAAQPAPEVLQRVAGEGMSILIRDAALDPRFAGQPVGSVVCAPLKAARKVLGAIYCETCPGGAAFSEADLKLATAVGRQAGGAIERRILEGQLQEQALELEARVRERTAELSSALEGLKSAQERLVASERLAAVGMLVQGIAHNMATPLSGILGFAQVLKARHPELPHVDEIIRLSRYLDGIIENLLSKSRHENSQEPVRVDLNAVAAQTLKFFEGDMFFKHQVQVCLEASAAPPVVWGLWSDFSQALQNLVKNALDALRESARRELKVRTRTDGENAILEVEDSGPGIPEADRERIFDAFFTTKGSGGTGLGLFTTRNLLAPWGARIEVESAPGRTVFRVTARAAGVSGEDR